MPIKINDHLSAICQLQEEGILITYNKLRKFNSKR